MKRPIFFSSFFSMKFSGSKFLTSAAIWQANWEASKWVMGAPHPTDRASNACHGPRSPPRAGSRDGSQ